MNLRKKADLKKDRLTEKKLLLKRENHTDSQGLTKETKTIKLSSSSKIYMITANGEKEISLSDLKEGEMIKITAKI